MLKEALEGLQIKPDGVYVDMTFGGGGHSRAILENLGPEGHLYAFDQDLDAMAGAPDDERFTFVRSNFRYLQNWMQYYGVEGVDGILADLGVSSHHLDNGARGFSFRCDAPLDMRMNQRARLTAREVVNNYSEEQLADILYLYGELKQSRRLATAIVKARQTAPIETTGQLADLLNPLLGPQREKKDLARDFCAETALTLRNLGYETANPTSAESLSAMSDDLLLEAQACQTEFGREFREIAISARMAIDKTDIIPSGLRAIEAAWKPVFQIDVASAGDAAYKLIQAMPELAGTTTLYRMLGMNVREAEELAEKSRNARPNDFMQIGRGE